MYVFVPSCEMFIKMVSYFVVAKISKHMWAGYSLGSLGMF